MKTEIDRICGIMYTLLEHQPVIDVPYEKINDIAVALVKEGYGKVSEYETEREMLGSKIKVLEQRLNNKYIEIDNLNRDYRNSFERLKAQEREIERLRTTLGQCNAELNSALESLKSQCREIGELKAGTKQAKIDVLNEVKKRIYDISPYNPLVTKDNVKYFIDKLIKEVQNAENKG